MLNRGSTEDFLMLTLQVHLFPKFPFGAITSKHGRQIKLVCLKKKKKPSDNGFFYVTVAAYFDKEGEIDRSSRLAIKNRWVVAKEIINLLKKSKQAIWQPFFEVHGSYILRQHFSSTQFQRCLCFVASLTLNCDYNICLGIPSCKNLGFPQGRPRHPYSFLFFYTCNLIIKFMAK